jgi:itaconate CoA-transferase
VLRRLLGRADVLVQNLAPAPRRGSASRSRRCTRRIPRLVVCDISGYGDDPARPGPYRDKKAYDLLIQSESGFLSVTGTADEPAKAGCSIADIAAGMYAYSSILAALIARGRSGLGRPHRRLDAREHGRVDGLSRCTTRTRAPSRRRAPAPRTRRSIPYGPFPAGDGGIVMLGLQNEREWRVFCEQVLGQPGLADDPRFASNSKRHGARDALRALIVAAFAGLDADQVVARLDRAQIANARVNDMADVWSHAQLRARERWVEVTTAAGPIPALLPPARRRRTRRAWTPVPALGAHTDAILAELGYSASQTVALRAAEAV